MAGAATARAPAHRAKREGSFRPSPAPAPATASDGVLRRCACGGGCPSCRKEKEGELRRARAEGATAVGLAPPVVHQVLASPGRPLEGAARGRMEAGFGADFSGVRVHDDAHAAESAAAVDAHAYAVGRDVVFAAGRYAPGTPAGDRLLAHELAHVVQGRPGLARAPRSLSGDIDPSRTSPTDVAQEIAEIRRWLADRADRPDDLQATHLRAQLARLLAHGRGAPYASPWERFAASFNREFAEVLHVLVPGSHAAAVTRPAGAAVRPLDAGLLMGLLTEGQRDKLMDFMLTRRIPERLFNGTDRGLANAQQRLLLSAHILANGVYRPGSFDQRVHAQSCWHWVQIVHHYAGATPAGSGLDRGVRGSFDPLGAAALGTGKFDFIWHPKYVRKPDLPPTEAPGGTGPLHEGTMHEEAARKAEAADPSKARDFHRQPALPIERFDELRAGDWLWFYNANRSEGGGHSVIFSHWLGATQTDVKNGVRYRFREAIVWSQPSAKHGGVRHPARLGDQFVANPDNNLYPFATPITHVSRVTPESAPATTPMQVVASLGGAGSAGVAAENERFIRTKEASLKGTLDREWLRQWLRYQNRDLVAELQPHLSAGQVRLLLAVNQEHDLEALVRLYQRLNTLVTNARVLDANTAATFARLNPQHATASARAGVVRETAKREILGIDLELGNIATSTAWREARRAELDVDPEIKRLRGELNGLAAKIAAAKAGTSRDALKQEQKEVGERIKSLEALKKGQAPEMGMVTSDLAKLAGRKKTLEAKRAALAKTRDTADANLPWGYVHPGDLGKEDKSGTTGKLADLKPAPDWTKLVVPTTPSTPPAPSTQKKP